VESEKKNHTSKATEVKSWIMTARIHMQKKSNKEAEEVLRHAVEQIPDSLEAWTELCILLLSLRKETDAERAGKQILRLRNEKRITWAQLRSELRLKYVIGKQVPEIKEDIQPTDDDSSTYPSRVRSPRQRVRVDPDSEPVVAGTKRPLRRETRKSPRRKLREDSASKTEVAVPKKSSERESTSLDETENRTADNWYEFAKLYQKQEQYPDALRALWKTLELDPGKVDAQVRIGEVYIKQAKYTDAITWLNQALAKNTESAHTWYLLGIAHLELGKYWDASQALHESVKINDDHFDAWVQLGISLAKQSRHVQAQKAFLHALKHKRKDPDLLYQYALSLREEGKLTRAENVLRMAIGYRKDFAEAWNELGEILMSLGKLEEGGRAKRKARSFK